MSNPAQSQWTVSLSGGDSHGSGEIHTDWREQIRHGLEEAELLVMLTTPVTDHAAARQREEAGL